MNWKQEMLNVIPNVTYIFYLNLVPPFLLKYKYFVLKCFDNIFLIPGVRFYQIKSIAPFSWNVLNYFQVDWSDQLWVPGVSVSSFDRSLSVYLNKVRRRRLLATIMFNVGRRDNATRFGFFERSGRQICSQLLPKYLANLGYTLKKRHC